MREKKHANSVVRSVQLLVDRENRTFLRKKLTRHRIIMQKAWMKNRLNDTRKNSV